MRCASPARAGAPSSTSSGSRMARSSSTGMSRRTFPRRCRTATGCSDSGGGYFFTYFIIRLCPGLDVRASLVERHDARVGVAALPIGHEDVAVQRGDDGGRRVELVRTAAWLSGLAERHEQLAVRAELEHLMALAVAPEPVGDPHIA